ncbi:MAG: hypothetical protein V4487_08960 [Chlamydiota bacterium]
MSKKSSVWWRSWWVVGFCSVTCFIYFQALKEKKIAIRELQFRLEEKNKEKFLGLQEKEELYLRISSQNDPAWIEMILMRDLGVVPEGFLKVHFSKQSS